MLQSYVPCGRAVRISYPIFNFPIEFGWWRSLQHAILWCNLTSVLRHCVSRDTQNNSAERKWSVCQFVLCKSRDKTRDYLPLEARADSFQKHLKEIKMVKEKESRSNFNLWNEYIGVDSRSECNSHSVKSSSSGQCTWIFARGILLQCGLSLVVYLPKQSCRL